MKKRILSFICTLTLCLGLLPQAALADTGSTWNSNAINLFVGNVQLSGPQQGDTTGYYTQNSEGNWGKYTENGTPTGSYFYYDGSGGLTLHNVTIEGNNTRNAGISAYTGDDSTQDIKLTINLEGTNKVSGSSKGIEVQTQQGDATLEIKGFNGSGTLNATASNGLSNGIYVGVNNTNITNKSATLSISGGAGVTASSADQTFGGYGVCLQPAVNSSASLTVDGGSLTASGMTAGIEFSFGTVTTGTGTPP